MDRLAQFIDALRTRGIAGLRDEWSRLGRLRLEDRRYRKWASANAIDDRRRKVLAQHSASLERKPLLSIILPVYNVEAKWLTRCIESVRSQIYADWELCIADDASPKAHIKQLIESYAAKDERIRAVFRKENGHISAASNSALEVASGEFAVLLDHDDELTEDALFWVAKEIVDHPDTAMIYSNEDTIDENGELKTPRFKPDFSPDLMCSVNMVTHLSAYRMDIVRNIGGFRKGLEGSQDYDLALRVIEQIEPRQIRHIPRVLYHWRAIEGSVALSGGEKPYAHERARRAIREHHERLGRRVSVEETIYDLHRIRYEMPSPQPKVSIFVVRSDEIVADLSEIETMIDYDDLEITLVDARQNAAEVLDKAVRRSDGKVICLIRAGIIPTGRGRLHELVSFAIQPQIGCVGGKVVDRFGTTVDGGRIIGGGNISNIAHRGYTSGQGGNMLRNVVIGNYSAVSGSVLAMRRDVYESVGGFNYDDLCRSLYVEDLCLRLGEAGLRIVHDPYAEFRLSRHSRIKDEIDPADAAYFKTRWKEVVERDPFCDPNLKRDGSFTLDERV